jgi:chaperonin GroES
MKLRPLHDFVLIRREKAPEMSAGGLFMPQQAKETSRTGEVLATGPGRFLENGTRLPVGVEVGQVVYFRERVGQEVSLNGEVLYLIREFDIEGVVEL